MTYFTNMTNYLDLKYKKMDDIDKTFDVLRRVNFKTMWQILVVELNGLVFISHPILRSLIVNPACESILIKHHWTLDEFTKELYRER